MFVIKGFEDQIVLSPNVQAVQIRLVVLEMKQEESALVVGIVIMKVDCVVVLVDFMVLHATNKLFYFEIYPAPSNNFRTCVYNKLFSPPTKN